MDTPNLSNQLKRRRREMGLSLSQVARRANTSPPTLSRYENGWCRFETYTLQKLATALGCRLRIELEPCSAPPQPPQRSELLSRIRRLFWDRRLQASDLSRYPVWVVTRVLEYGELEDVRMLCDWMGRQGFLDAVAAARFSTPRTREFWRHMLEREGRPCTRKFSRSGAGSSWIG